VNKLALSIGSGNDQVLDEILADLSSMARTVLNAQNVESVSLSSTEAHMKDLFSNQAQAFLNSLPHNASDFKTKESIFEVTATKTFVATPFPVHFCGAAIPTVPYEHPDSAPLRVLAKLISAKYLHPEIREKGGAYGGGATSNPSSGLFSFYSYRDPNCQKTLDSFHGSLDWIMSNNFSERDIQEAKLGIFQAVDKPIMPGDRGLRGWISGITNEMFQQHRDRIRSVTRDDLLRVTAQYLNSEDRNIGISVIGPESTAKTLDNSWNVQMLLG